VVEKSTQVLEKKKRDCDEGFRSDRGERDDIQERRRRKCDMS